MGKSLSVVMVSAGFWPTVGGAERQALELSAALVQRGHKVTVLTRKIAGLPSKEIVRGVVIRRLPVIGEGSLNALCFLVASFLWLMYHWTDWDAVHAHLAGSPALSAALAGRLLGRPALVKLGGGRGIGELATSAKTTIGRWKLRVLAALRPKFLAVVPDLAEEAREFLGNANIEILPNGVDVNRFMPVSVKRKKELRAELGWNEDSTVYLYTGRFSPEKRLPWFLKLWEEASGDHSVAVLIGGGSELNAVQPFVSLGRIEIISPCENLSDMYAAADVFFLPSTSEGLSNALLEAMSSGLTILASRVGGTAETVEDGITGLLFDRDDETGLKAAVRRLTSEPGLSVKLGAAARAQAVERYSIERVVSRLEELYS
ncbi:MAG: glycosyltransferase family 4 protein [Elusimicrobiota bacterium]